MVLSAAPLGWAVASLLAIRSTKDCLPAVGLGVTALGTALLAIELAVGRSFVVALIARAGAGGGVGLAYPGLYIRATATGSRGFTATELATAVITAEAIGGLLGRAVGGTMSSHPGGLLASYVVFAFALFAAACAVGRISRRP